MFQPNSFAAQPLYGRRKLICLEATFAAYQRLLNADEVLVCLCDPNDEFRGQPVPMIINEDYEFEYLIGELEGEFIHGFYAVPVIDGTPFLESFDDSTPFITDVRRPVEEMVFAAIMTGIPIMKLLGNVA